MKSEDREYLTTFFSDLINYDANDPLKQIDPLTYRTPEGDTCLHIASLRGDLRAVKILIQAGLDVNLIGDMGNTPLHYARGKNHQEIVDFLTHNGARLEITNEFGE